ncbi:unnamed protein product [Heligmosomoides polygyrus]|uniref:Peptidase M14 carboxypeptidase A domain-containing protein n=1 Tax=Heligmosomoides polygyrus TaxID=6339 RepID=A0A3P8E2T3_HELPZ|nr:unnamed protein product [Heligmosomoides polygyrus]
MIRIYPDSDDTLRYLNTLYEGNSPYELDFWQPPTHVGAIVDVTVAPFDAPIFVRDLESKKLNYVVAVNDLEKQISGRRSVTGKKISMWIDAGIHAREWIAPATAMYIVHENRMWRKNRRPATCKRHHFHTVCCAGVDLNRNFDWFWSCKSVIV